MEHFNTGWHDLKYRFEKILYNDFKRDTYLKKTPKGYEVTDWGRVSENIPYPVVYKIPDLKDEKEIVNYLLKNNPELFL